MILFSFFREQTFTEDTRLVVEAMVSNRSLHRYNCLNPAPNGANSTPSCVTNPVLLTLHKILFHKSAWNVEDSSSRVDFRVIYQTWNLCNKETDTSCKSLQLIASNKIWCDKIRSNPFHRYSTLCMSQSMFGYVSKCGNVNQEEIYFGLWVQLESSGNVQLQSCQLL